MSTATKTDKKAPAYAEITVVLRAEADEDDSARERLEREISYMRRRIRSAAAASAEVVDVYEEYYDDQEDEQFQILDHNHQRQQKNEISRQQRHLPDGYWHEDGWRAYMESSGKVLVNVRTGARVQL